MNLWSEILRYERKLWPSVSCQSSQPAVWRSADGHSDFDVMRDGGAQLKAYQCVSKSTPISLVTSNKRLLYCSTHLINLALFSCQDEVTTENS